MKDESPIIDFSLSRRILTVVMNALARLLVSLPVHCLYGLRIHGRQNLRLPGRQGFVTVSNHCLFGEPIFAGMALWPRPLWYCVEQENVERKDVGWLCRLMGAFGIPEDKPLSITGSVRTALEKGHVVHIYPEGVLHWRNQEIAPFFRGAFFFSLTTGVPVVPVTTVLHRRRGWWLWKGLPPRVDYVVGSPVYPEEFLQRFRDRREALAAFSRAVREIMQKTIADRGGVQDLPGRISPAGNSVIA